MASGRDDFVIAIRSAFLKKGNRQKFSLFTLLIASCFVLCLEYFKTGPIETFRSLTRDLIYRGSYIVSMPITFTNQIYNNFRKHLYMYQEYSELIDKDFKLNSLQNKIKFYKSENEELRKLINEEVLEDGSYTLTKVIIDKQSPFLKSIIINKGFESGIKKGMAVLDRNYMVGRIVETNYLSSRILLMNDLNSKISVIIEPYNIKGIMTGSGSSYAELEYISKTGSIEEGNIVYTSGSDGIFSAGIPIGKVEIKNQKKIVNFFADLDQINFVKIKHFKESE